MQRLLLDRQPVPIEHQSLGIDLWDAKPYCEPDKGGEFIQVRLECGKPQRDAWRVTAALLLYGDERTDIADHPFELIHTSELGICCSRRRIHRDTVFIQTA